MDIENSTITLSDTSSILIGGQLRLYVDQKGYLIISSTDLEDEGLVQLKACKNFVLNASLKDAVTATVDIYVSHCESLAVSDWTFKLIKEETGGE
jgi:hypothetical protein